MSCKLEEAINDMKVLAEKPGAAKIKAQLDNVLAQIGSHKEQSTAELKSIVSNTQRTLPKDYYKVMNKLVRKLIGPKVTTSEYLAFSEMALQKVAIVGGKYAKGKVTLSKTPNQDALEAQARGMFEAWYIDESPYGVAYQNIQNDAEEVAKQLTNDKRFQGMVKDWVPKVAAEMLVQFGKANGMHTLAHELVHAGSAEYMKANPDDKLTKRVHELYNEALDNKVQIMRLMGKGSNDYWTTSVDEFVAEGLSNPDLVYALRNIKIEGRAKYGNIFNDLLNVLLKMVGVTNTDSIYEYLLNGYIAMIESQAKPLAANKLLDKMKQDIVSGKYDTAVEEVKGSDENAEIGTKADDVLVGEEETDLGQMLKNDFIAYLEFDKQEGRDIQTEEFAQLQNHILDTYEATMQNLDTGNVKVEMFESTVDQTAGQVNLQTREMKVRWNKMSRMARVSEVFLHEVNHLMSAHVFAENPKLRKLMEELRDAAVKNGATYKLFLEGITNPTAEEVEIAKQKFEYTFDKTADAEEFYAYATTNEQVYNAVKDVQITTPLVKLLDMDPSKKEPFKKVMNALITMVNKVWRQLSGRGVRGGQMIADMVTTIARLDAEQAQRKQQEVMQDEASDYAKVKMSQLDESIEPVVQKVDEWVDKIGAKVNGTALGKLVRKIPVLNDLMETGISQYLWRMVTQDTTKQDVADMYMIFRHAKQEIEKHTSKIQNGVSSVATELYKDVDKDTKVAVHKLIMEGDLAQFTADELLGYIQNSKLVEQEISKLEKEILDNNTTGDIGTIKEQVEGLVEYLVSGKTVVHNQQFNANNIATNLMAGNKKQVLKTNTKIIKPLDKLISLKVLQKSDKELTARLQKLLETAEGREIADKTINMYRGYIDGMREDATIGAYDPIPKGYAKVENGLIKYELIPESEVKAQESVRMKLVEAKPYVKVGGVNYYLMTGMTKTIGFEEGAIGLISHTTEGIPVSQLVRKNNELAGKFELSESDLKAKTKKLVKAINEQDENVLKEFKMIAGQTLIPVYDHQNEIVDYRIQLTKIEQEMYMPDRKTELEDVMSHTFSRSVKTTLTASENKKVVNQILLHSSKGIAENPDDYVIVEEYTEEDRRNGVKYEKRHDRWKYLPDHTKDYIFQMTGHKAIPIHRDFVELMTGEKDVTIGNFAKFGMDIRRHPVARARLMALESYIKEILGYVKNAMVVLNADVLIGNQTSNAIVAMTHGIGIVDYTKKFKQRWDALNDYNEKSQLLAELEVRKMAGENVDSKIKQLKKQLEGNVWDELVKDGQYTALVEDIQIEGQGEGQLLTQAKEWLDKKNWLGAVDNVKNALYINRTSGLYNTMLKTVHYGDAITRQIIKEELEKKALAKNGKVTKEVEREILNYLDQLLVNYGYTMNRWWKYAEKVGGLFFMKYYLNQAKAIMSMTKRNPSRTALLQGGQWITGLDFQDPIDTYSRSGIDGFGYRWMLDDAPGELLAPNIFSLIPDISSIIQIR